MTSPLLSLDEVAEKLGLPCDTPAHRRASRKKAKRIVVREFDTYFDIPHVLDNIKVPADALDTFLRKRKRAGLIHGEVDENSEVGRALRGGMA